MALSRIGHNYDLNLAVLSHTELTNQLISLGLSSELIESMTFGSPMKVDGKSAEISIPDSLIENIYTIFYFDSNTLTWQKVKKFRQVGNKIVLDKSYYGLLLAYPFDAFRETYYSDGEYEYEMYLTRVDSKIYRNIAISSSSYQQSSIISLLFSFNKLGPWAPTITSASLFNTFYMKVNISGMDSVVSTQVIPTELITISCITCE